MRDLFSIDFTVDSAGDLERDECEVLGRITIGDFYEGFYSILQLWEIPDYRKQWREGLQRIIEGFPSSCLMVNIHEPKSANFFEW